MSESVQMPALGESVTEGTVTRWLKQVGDRVEVDEPLVEVATDKVDTEIPSPVAGVLEEILVEEDETVEVGADLARIGQGLPRSGGTPNTSSSNGAVDGDRWSAGSQRSGPPERSDQPVPAPSSAAAAAAAGQSGTPSGEGTPVVMPALGESVTEGTVTRWLKEEGDTVEVDEPLVEVATDKVDTEIPSPVAGVLQRILVAEDDIAQVGDSLAILTPPGSRPSAPTSSAHASATHASATHASTAHASATPAPSAPVSRSQAAHSRSSRAAPNDPSVYVTPLVRKLAVENRVDLSRVRGTGVGGRIRKHDVLETAEADRAAGVAAGSGRSPAAQPPQTHRAPTPVVSALRGTTEKMSRLRKVIAQRMVESLQVSAQLTTVVEADVTRIARLRVRARAEFESREGVKLSFLPFFALAAVEALKQYPVLNASVDGDTIVYHADENLGVAVDTERGLLVPVIRQAGDLNIAGLARKIADLADRTRNNKITPDEATGGTFTLTNTGSRGALFDTPIINQPQVGILGTGTVVKRPVVVTGPDGEETIAVRSMVNLALSYDHRIVDGADAARFLMAIKQRLEEGAFEADLGL
ncbi:MAG: hypothetical protein QG608_614 [Actinomycetota bacterium]|nr:hypothetical protein [Actinomycetota bacterium]